MDPQICYFVLSLRVVTFIWSALAKSNHQYLVTAVSFTLNDEMNLIA